MHLVFDDGEREWELTIDIRQPSAAVADLIAALAPDAPPDAALLVGARVVGPDIELDEAGLRDGDRVAIARARPLRGGRESGATAVVSLDVVGGLDAGARHPLPAQPRVVVGRDPSCDVVVAHPTVSRRHLSLAIARTGAVTATDLGSRNGTWRGDEALQGDVVVGPTDVVRLGAVHVIARGQPADDRASRGRALGIGVSGVLPFNRPPRTALPPPPGPVAVPEPPRSASGSSALSVASIVGPLALAAVMVVVLGNPAFALFAALSPVLLIGTHVEQRRRASRATGQEAARYATALGRFREALDAARAAEGHRRDRVLPDLAEVHRRATESSVRLWERCPAHDDWLRLRAGLGAIEWQPELIESRDARTPQVEAVLAESGALWDAPVEIDLSHNGVVGVVGPRAAALAVAHSLVVQAAVHHGPADLLIAVLASERNGRDWDWAKWLPHTRATDGSGPLLASDPAGASAIAQAALASRAAHPVLLVVVDDETLLDGRRAPVRALLNGRGCAVAGIVLASTTERLPSVCRTIVELRGDDGVATVWLPHEGEHAQAVLAAGVSGATAREIARSLAGFDDPEVDVPGSGLPDEARLLALLELDVRMSGEQLLERWTNAGSDPPCRAPIGVGLDGAFVVDLARDGPHALVAGTTGAGKSELLRTLVLGLSTSASPDHLTFLLIDFKGGSAFDQCVRLPHTVGVLTDLDEALAARALRCLDAEIRFRERLLREFGASDLASYREHDRDDRPPLPRLIVVVDEFATLKSELPDFVDSLVGVAQRGRSLGVHLVLATQRPAGAVSENIRANTSVRIALRVHDPADSIDVVGTASAADLPRHRPGRAIVRLGPGEIVPIQTALSSRPAGCGDAAPVVVTPFGFGPRSRSVTDDATRRGPSELALIVDAAAAAHAASGRPLPRRPCPDPLEEDIDLAAVLDLGGDDEWLVPFGLADDPDRQCHDVHAWRPTAGNLLLWGVGGSGTSTALASIAFALASRHGVDDVHLYVLAAGGGELQPLATLPHCGAAIGIGERERQARLLRMLRSELDGRQRAPRVSVAERPSIVLLVDGYAAFAAEHADLAGAQATDDLARLFADGPDVGIHTVIAADRIAAVPHALAALASQRLLFRLADAHDYAMAGTTSVRPTALCRGRAIDAVTGRVVQVARVAHLDETIASIVRRTPPARRAPAPIGTLPTRVGVGSVGRAVLSDRPWSIPIGIGERDLAPVGFTLFAGEHALIAGPARSGRSTALAAVASVVSHDASALTVVIAGPRSPLPADFVTMNVHDAVATVVAHRGPALLLIDDAELVDDPTGVLSALVDAHHQNISVIAAGRAESLRTAYTHWTRGLRRSKTGLLLQPHVDLDGELLGVTLPRRAPVAFCTGRGWLVSGTDIQVCHAAMPPLTDTERS